MQNQRTPAQERTTIDRASQVDNLMLTYQRLRAWRRFIHPSLPGLLCVNLMNDVNPLYLHALRYVGVLRLLFLIRHLYLIGVWLSEDQRTNMMKTQFGLRCQIFFTSYYSTLNTEHNWEDLSIQLRNQQTCAFNNQN